MKKKIFDHCYLADKMAEPQDAKKFATKSVHAGYEINTCSDRPIIPPIFLSSCYDYDTVENYAGDFYYSRHGNRSRDTLEKNIASLEDAEYGLCFSSGMTTIFSVFYLLNAGDHVICNDVLYGGTLKMLKSYTSQKGIEVSYVNMCDVAEVRKSIKKNTKMIYGEPCTNPLVTVIDVAKLSAEAKENGILFVVDNTFITPYFMKPLKLGVDIVLHSATKFINGHGDVVMGALATNRLDLYKSLKDIQTSLGFVPSPFDCFLVTRGIKTLPLRMRAHMVNALIVGTFLQQHPRVAKVLYPGLASHPQHELAKQQFSGYGGVLGFFLKGGREEVETVLSSLTMIKVTGSLGQCGSVISYPATVSHSYIEASKRSALGITNNYVRLAVGIEDSDDIINDLKTALEALA